MAMTPIQEALKKRRQNQAAKYGVETPQPDIIPEVTVEEEDES